MNNFEFYCPGKIRFGIDEIRNLKDYMQSLHISKPIVVTDKMLRSTPVISQVIAEMELDLVFDNIQPNPHQRNGHELKACGAMTATLIVFGGGSSMDCAKGAAVVSYTQNDVAATMTLRSISFPLRKSCPLSPFPPLPAPDRRFPNTPSFRTKRPT